MREVQIQIYEEAWNQEGEPFVEYCKDIFQIDLNQLFHITFIENPYMDKMAWPPILPEGSIVLDSVEIARYVFATHSNILVTTDLSRDGEVDYLPTAKEFDPDRFSGLVFYLSPIHYSQLKAELEPMARGPKSARDTLPFSDLTDTLIYDFILNTILRYVEENMGGKSPDRLFEIAKRNGLIPVKDIQVEALRRTPRSEKTMKVEDWQHAIMQYQNRLATFIRIGWLTSDKSFLQEFENKVKITRKTYLDALVFDPNGERLAWKEKFFADIAEQEDEVKALFEEIGFEW
jgi:hypothetical protein